MTLLSIGNLFRYFIYNPDSDFLTPRESKIAHYASAILEKLSCSYFSRLRNPSKGNYKWTEREIFIIKKRIRNKILEINDHYRRITRSPEHQNSLCTEREITPLKPLNKVSSHMIFRNLYLGDYNAFADACSGSAMVSQGTSRSFQKVITLCPLKYLRKKFIQFPSSESIKLNFENNQIKWLYIGKTISNSNFSWFAMVHDCTFFEECNSYLETMEAKTNKKIQSTWKSHAKKFVNYDIKNKRLDVAVKYEEWFEPLFKEIDKAVFSDEMILVHCQTGVSISSTFLAAYMINRFAISSAEALYFLQIRRPCVKSKLEKELEDYSYCLASERGQTTR